MTKTISYYLIPVVLVVLAFSAVARRAAVVPGQEEVRTTSSFSLLSAHQSPQKQQLQRQNAQGVSSVTPHYLPAAHRGRRLQKKVVYYPGSSTSTAASVLGSTSDKKASRQQPRIRRKLNSFWEDLPEGLNPQNNRHWSEPQQHNTKNKPMSKRYLRPAV